MNNEGLNKTSIVVKGPIQETEAPFRVNVDVLKKRLIEQQRKDGIVKRTIILSTLVVSLGALTILTN